MPRPLKVRLTTKGKNRKLDVVVLPIGPAPREVKVAGWLEASYPKPG